MTDRHPPHTAAAIDAITAAVTAERDFPGWLSLVLAYAAARSGSVSALTAGRPGSWEAAHVDALVRGLIGDATDLAAFAADDRRKREQDGPAPGVA